MISECCGAIPWGEWDKFKGIYSGICSECKEHCTFVDEEDEDEFI